jgi:hypothetical protein
MRDTWFKDNLLYNLLDLDISAILKEQVDKLIETLDLPEIQITEVKDKENLLETLVIEVPAAPASTTTTALSEKTSEPMQRQLSTLSQSPSVALTATVSNDALTLLNTPGNQAQRENEISADFDL